MPKNELIPLNSPNGRIEVLNEGALKWIRVSQICDTLGINRATFYRIIERDPSLVPEGHTALLPWPTVGGDQAIRVFSMDAMLEVAMEVSNKRARAMRRWLVALLRGQAPVSRPAADTLARLPDARAILALPMIRIAISRLDALDAADAEHQTRQAKQRAEITRQAALHNLSLDGLRKLRQLERILASIPSLAIQPTLNLEG